MPGKQSTRLHTKPTHKALLFCRLLVEMGDQSVAYSMAFYGNKKGDPVPASARYNSSTILRNPHIIAEIARLRRMAEEVAMEKVGITKADVMQKLQDIATEAAADGKYAAAVSAIELIGKELGMFVDKKEVRVGPLATVPEHALDDMIRDTAKRIAELTGETLEYTEFTESPANQVQH